MPGWQVRVAPTAGVPEIVGSVAFTGGDGTLKGSDEAEAEPAMFVAVSRQRSSEPGSCAVIVYVVVVSPAIGAPSRSQA